MTEEIVEGLKKTVAIVRSFGFSGIGEFVKTRLLGAGIGQVVVVVPIQQDRGMTRTVIEGMHDDRIHLLERSFDHGGRAWAAMLNVGLDYIEQAKLAPEFILMVSNTVKLESEHLASLVKTMQFSRSITLTGGRFRGITRNGGAVPIGAIYNNHLRNTLSLYRATVFQGGIPHLRRFDEAFDGAGGMEDFAFQILLKVLGYHWVVPSDIEVPIEVLQNRTEKEQAAYEVLMQRGIDVARARAIAMLCSNHSR
jgi:hypothetical protein